MHCKIRKQSLYTVFFLFLWKPRVTWHSFKQFQVNVSFFLCFLGGHLVWHKNHWMYKYKSWSNIVGITVLQACGVVPESCLVELLAAWITNITPVSVWFKSSGLQGWGFWDAGVRGALHCRWWSSIVVYHPLGQSSHLCRIKVRDVRLRNWAQILKTLASFSVNDKSILNCNSVLCFFSCP